METTNERKSKYKTVRDLADYLNSTGLFRKHIVQQDVFHAFENAGLFIRNPEDNKLYPSEFFIKSGGCFVTKSKIVLFTEQMFSLMTKDTKAYTNFDWMSWFTKMYNLKEPLEEQTKDCLSDIDQKIMKNALITIDDESTDTENNHEDSDKWICGNCGKSVDSLYTITEWCTLKQIDRSTKKILLKHAEEQHFDSDICEECFNSLFTKKESKSTRFLVKIGQKWTIFNENSLEIAKKTKKISKIIKLNDKK